ncbi:hypothetical protein ACIBG8_54280 [Nonomuraea sp. NPDC050556]|uniref:hypothetical protein n=1 Tax=Nonomuraea sp. NPDC050556 TaxID=3364369 RepID=UPI0037B8BDDD
MAKVTPNFKLPYPESSDESKTWQYWQSLAERLDTVLAAYMGPRVQLSSTASQSIPTSGAQLLFGTTDYEQPASGWQITPEAPGTVMHAPVAGIYLAFLMVQFASVTTPSGNRAISVDMWDSSQSAYVGGISQYKSPITAAMRVSVCGTLPLTAGQKVRPYAYSSQSTAVNVASGTWSMTLLSASVAAVLSSELASVQYGSEQRDW